MGLPCALRIPLPDLPRPFDRLPLKTPPPLLIYRPPIICSLAASARSMHNGTPSNGPSGLKIAPGTWGHKKFKLRNLYAQLTDVDLLFLEGQEAELVARIQARLSLSAEEVQALITRL